MNEAVWKSTNLFIPWLYNLSPFQIQPKRFSCCRVKDSKYTQTHVHSLIYLFIWRRMMLYDTMICPMQCVLQFRIATSCDKLHCAHHFETSILRSHYVQFKFILYNWLLLLSNLYLNSFFLNIFPDESSFRYKPKQKNNITVTVNFCRYKTTYLVFRSSYSCVNRITNK